MASTATVTGKLDPKKDALAKNGSQLRLAYQTSLGKMYQGLAEDLLNSSFGKRQHGKVQLILTSPPFPLNRKKRYGNIQGEDYIEWLASFATLFKDILAPRGSIVLEVGNSWEPGSPVMSTLALRALLKFHDVGGLQLCQQFVCYNPAKLPGPAQWVNIERVRVKDAYTNIWWMSPSDRPMADNRKVLTPYTDSMLDLLRKRKYNPGRRPSEHIIGEESFFKDNGGAIPSNVLQYSNTRSSDSYLEYCRARGLTPHPARMPTELAEFFIKFLTKPRDLVFDPFAGSNVTGASAQGLGRRWVGVEPNSEYIESSRGRFTALDM